ncbi:NAD(P)/FAD-dependent oxidoreductase [Nocardioides sp.]|uniref:phytoene desaturase family protein n=1 Tax=Nocardioides sp. TaxID=35761 RepID=UPI001A18D8C9|nr:NAD(P)/FAD-dependent oxidoreductase [Nocardioides sp.]MBJ7359633.1 NAD(P)/FAD-dependent oxidoreductase [Nocardioides sp.]
MTQYDAIVIGAGHNGLTSALVLQRAGLRTLLLESKRYTGGMASNVELFDGYRFEIAGSVQISTSAEVSRELGLDTLPTVDLEVMSVSLLGNGDEPLIYYTDPMRLFEHLVGVHGEEVVDAMAMLAAWSTAPAKALGRFEARALPKTLDEMYAVATNAFERQAIDDLIYGSVTDVLDRFIPDKEKHGALRGMLSFLAINTVYRGPATPGTAASLAYGFAMPSAEAQLVSKIRGGIGVLSEHLVEQFEAAGGELRMNASVDQILATDGRVTGVRLAPHDQQSGEEIPAPVVVSSLAPDLTVLDLVQPGALPDESLAPYRGIDHRGSYVQMHFALDGMPTFAAPYEMLNDPANQGSIGLFATPEELQQQWEDCRKGIVPERPAVALQFPSVHDPDLAPPGKVAASAFALWFPVEADPERYGALKVEMGQRVIERINGIAPDFESKIIRHTTFTPKHMGTMFGAPGGDYCHGLMHADQMGHNRPGPRGYVHDPLPLAGLCLGGCGCHGGPGITFVPGYNAAHAALEDAR